MDAMHALADVYLYAAVKIPLYGYESYEDMKESMPYYRVAFIVRRTQFRRFFLGT